MKYKNILQTIGNTPIVELKRYSPNKNIKIFAKLEGVNPSGSIKDRIAVFMIDKARKKGLLKPGVELIEPTSGNTGISLAMVSAILGYKFTAVMPDNVSIERRKLIESYGGRVILSQGKNNYLGDIILVREIIKKNPKKYLILNQFNNPDNVEANYQTTGREIISQIPNITHFIAGIGTAGTLIGVSKRLKLYNQKIKTIGLDPPPQTTIQGLRNLFINKPAIFDNSYIDDIISIKNEDVAFELMKDLAKKEGLSVGISSGAALWGAIEVSKKIKQGIIVVIFADRGDRYLSLL